jgi:hypothetical protein
MAKHWKLVQQEENPSSVQLQHDSHIRPLSDAS